MKIIEVTIEDQDVSEVAAFLAGRARSLSIKHVFDAPARRRVETEEAAPVSEQPSAPRPPAKTLMKKNPNRASAAAKAAEARKNGRASRKSIFESFIRGRTGFAIGELKDAMVQKGHRANAASAFVIELMSKGEVERVDVGRYRVKQG